MIVIKLGGSLAFSDVLDSCFESVVRYACEKPVVVVPGGGVFADQVRMAQQYWRFNDHAAHQMAILAMQQMSLMLQALQSTWKITSDINDIFEKAAIGKVIIWSPNIVDLDRKEIPASWDVTSDSLSAWLATQLNASELILVKSTEVSSTAGILQLQAQGIVDPAFHLFVANADFSVRIIGHQQF